MEYTCLIHPFIVSQIQELKEIHKIPVEIDVKGSFMGLRRVIMTFEEKDMDIVDWMRDTALDAYFQKYEQAELAESENV